MNSKPDDLPRLDPGESMLPRKRLLNLHMEANKYQEATNLLPPLDSPQPPLDPSQPLPDTDIAKWIEYHLVCDGVKKRPSFPDLAPRTNAPKDSEPETYAC